MSYIQIIVQTFPAPNDAWRALAHRTDTVARPEYRGLGGSEHAAAEDAVGQLLRESMGVR